MADEDEDITIDLRLRDYLTGGAAAAAKEMEELSESTKKAARALLLLDKRADKAASSLLKLAAAARTARGSINDLSDSNDRLNTSMGKNVQTQNLLGKAFNRTNKHQQKVNRDNNRLRRSFGLVTRAVRGAVTSMFALSRVLALVGAASVAGAALPQLLAISAALASMASFAAVLPVALGGLIAVVTTAKFAFGGLGDAIKAAASGDAEALKKATEKMGPAAKRFVKELTPALKLFKGMKNTVQGALFKTLDESIPQALKKLEPVIRKGMSGIARQLGGFLNQLGRYFSSSAGRKMFGRFFEAGTDIVNLLARNIAPLLSGLGRIIEAAMPFWDRFIAASDDALGKFSEWMTKISENDQLQGWLDTATTTAKLLGGILSNVGGIITGIIDAAGGAGAGTGALGGIGVALGEINKWVNSFEGQNSLGTFFQSLGEIASAVMPIIQIIANTLGTVLGPALADIVTGLAPGATVFFQGLATALAGIAPFVGPLAAAIGGLFVALTPLLEPIGLLIQLIGAALTPVIQILAPILGILASAISAILTPVLNVLITMFQAIQPYIPQITAAFSQMSAVLIPVFAEVGSTLASAFLPLIDQFIDMLPELIPQVTELAVSIGEFLANAITEVMPLVKPLIEFVISMWQRSLALVPIIIMVINAIIWLGNAILPVIGFIAEIIGWFINLGTEANRAATKVIQWFAKMLSKIKEVPDLVSSAFSSVYNAITGPFRRAYDSVMGIIGDIKSAISNIDIGSTLDSINPFRFAGGPVTAGSQYTVGEIGKELFVGNNGKTELIGAGGMDPSWTAPSSGTIIPSFLLGAFNKMEQSIQALAVSEQSAGMGARELARVAGAVAEAVGGESHHYHVPVTVQGNVTKEVDIERAVGKAIDRIERDKKERR